MWNGDSNKTLYLCLILGFEFCCYKGASDFHNESRIPSFTECVIQTFFSVSQPLTLVLSHTHTTQFVRVFSDLLFHSGTENVNVKKTTNVTFTDGLGLLLWKKLRRHIESFTLKTINIMTCELFATKLCWMLVFLFQWNKRYLIMKWEQIDIRNDAADHGFLRMNLFFRHFCENTLKERTRNTQHARKKDVNTVT